MSTCTATALDPRIDHHHEAVRCELPSGHVGHHSGSIPQPPYEPMTYGWPQTEVRHTFTVTPHSAPQREFGGPCRCCGQNTLRTYYSDVDIMGQRKAIILETCGCPGEREALQRNTSDA